MLLGWALFFLLVAIAAGLLGFPTIAKTSSTIARILFALFLIMILIFALILAFVF